MNPFWKMAAPWIGGAAVVMALGAAFALNGAHREAAGVAKERARAESAQRAMTEAYQLEKDRADAQYRGAVLAREAAKTGLAAARADLDRLLRANGRDPANPRAGRRPDETGPDWIGGFAACYAEYGDLAADAAGWADQVNGLQGYIRGLRGAKP
ncbi:hypothetical protein LMG7053_02347 [Achromobacter ruhlandii]|uniref:DUF2514 domain-containing protein n=1 Tax=Achromobacter ruhlandii TaxID=72557 RepID=A0ABM8LTK4_9BURK|nr:hypothetical protein [Achromobacter ruhlandii]CAB3947253.1 hypothetical protein LMG7053_02347 [Achromobacter ruhlandii]